MPNSSRLGSRSLIAPLLLWALAGCSTAIEENKLPPQTRAALEKPDRFVLYSLDPHESLAPADVEDDRNFHGYVVLGTVEIENPVGRKKLVDALERGVRENKGMVAGCFIPRHGIRVQTGDLTMDLVICFECLSANIYENGQQSAQILLTNSPQPLFNAVLQAAGVPLPERPN